MLGIVSLGSPGWLAARVLSRGGTFFKRFLPGICIFNASAVCVLKPHALCRRGGEVRCIAAQQLNAMAWYLASREFGESPSLVLTSYFMAFCLTTTDRVQLRYYWRHISAFALIVIPRKRCDRDRWIQVFPMQKVILPCVCYLGLM